MVRWHDFVIELHGSVVQGTRPTRTSLATPNEVDVDDYWRGPGGARRRTK